MLVRLAIQTGIPPSVWHAEELEDVLTAVQLLDEDAARERAAVKGGPQD